MAAAVETLFYVGRETPWHGMGVSVESAPTSEDAIVAAGLDWTVSKEKVFTESGIQIPGFFATTRNTDGSVYGMVTSKYQVVQNSEAFAFMDALLDIDGDVHYETAGSLFGGKKVWMLAKMPEILVNDDKVESYCVITNSHDGKNAVQVCCTPIRVVCNNTLNMALSNASRIWSTRHVGSLEGKLEDAKMTLEFANKYNTELIAFADQMANTSVNPIQFNRFVNEMWVIDDKASDRQKNNIIQLQDEFRNYYNRDDVKKFQGSAWGVLMALTDFTQHREPDRQTSTLAERRFDAVLSNTNDVTKGQKILSSILAA